MPCRASGAAGTERPCRAAETTGPGARPPPCCRRGGLVPAVERLHQRPRAGVRDRPQARQHRLRPVLLRHAPQAVHLPAVPVRAAAGRVAGRQRQQVHPENSVAWCEMSARAPGGCRPPAAGTRRRGRRGAARSGWRRGPRCTAASAGRRVIAVWVNVRVQQQRPRQRPARVGGVPHHAVQFARDAAQAPGTEAPGPSAGLLTVCAWVTPRPSAFHVWRSSPPKPRLAAQGEHLIVEALHQVLLAVVEGGDGDVAQAAVQGPHQCLGAGLGQVRLDGGEDDVGTGRGPDRSGRRGGRAGRAAGRRPSC